MSNRLKKILECKHARVQEFTEICLDCGENIYITKKQIMKDENKKTSSKSKCQHKNVQDFTETCLDCGKNIWD